MTTANELLKNQLAALPKALQTLATGQRWLIGVGVALVVLLLGGVGWWRADESYQYAFTNLVADDGAEIGATLKSAQIPYRLEAGGTALAVPGSRVYEVRLLLATAGLPRSGGTGFELFDRADLGVSEFTQKVNLRRATEGELARTLGRLAGVRSARIHLTMAERGLFREQEHPASAAVVLNLQPGRSLTERELAGIRHLVASSVPGLAPTAVTIVDGRGTMLATEPAWGEEANAFQRTLERDLEQRIVGILEPAVGVGQVVARVTASVDATEVNTNAEVVDPDGTALRSERTVAQNQQQETGGSQNLAGAAGNQLAQQSTSQTGPRSNSNSQEETRNWEVSKTTTRTVVRAPRLSRISVAIMLDGVDGKPRSEAEVARLGELARRAVGLDAARGDQFSISSSVFTHSGDEVAAPATATISTPVMVSTGVGIAVLGAIVAVVLLRRRKKLPVEPTEELLTPGATVAEIERRQRPSAPEVRPALPVVDPPPALPDPLIALRERARELARTDPVRAAHLIRAWVSVDAEVKEASRG